MEKKYLDKFENYKILIPDELADAIEAFLNRRDVEVETLVTLLANKDFNELKLIGHKIKGHGGGFGFEGISIIGRSIEMYAESNDYEKLSESIEEYKNYILYLNEEVLGDGV